MDPLPAVNKVFSLVSQEERQRQIGSQFAANSNSVNNMAFMVKNDQNNMSASAGRSAGTGGSYNAHSNKGQKKERPFGTYCNYPGHTVEKCYKLHGYPLGFKHKQ